MGSQRIASIENQGSSIKYFHTNHLGSTDTVTDVNGQPIVHYEYSPYGEIALTEGGDSTDYKFTGKPLDDETGLYYYGARYYNPTIGRFITPDTIVQAPYDPQSLNRYSYCRNNPVNYVDPTGNKWSWKKFWHSFEGVFVGVITTLILGPGGALAWYGWTMAGIVGGALGGAITGGLEGGWQGMLIGAATGGALGGLGGWAIGHEAGGLLAGMFVAGTGYAAATDSWDSYAGGIAGSLAGWGVGKGITSAYKQQFANYRAGNGFKSNVDVIIAKVKSGEIKWQDVVSNFNDTNTSTENRAMLSEALQKIVNKINLLTKAGGYFEGTATFEGSVKDINIFGLKWSGPFKSSEVPISTLPFGAERTWGTPLKVSFNGSLLDVPFAGGTANIHYQVQGNIYGYRTSDSNIWGNSGVLYEKYQKE